jgi:hypothetical protein
MPEMPELYMHRTERADATGTAISLLSREKKLKCDE